MQSTALLDDLRQRTLQVIEKVQPLLEVEAALLNHKAEPKRWSVLECLEHLNRYGDFYLPEIQRQIEQSQHPAVPQFKTGWLGNRFANSVADKAVINTMPAPPKSNPNGSQLDRQVVQTFLDQQQQMLDLLTQAAKVDLTKTKTGISLSSWIRLRLGDTFKVVIFHNQRHVSQALRALATAQQAMV